MIFHHRISLFTQFVMMTSNNQHGRIVKIDIRASLGLLLSITLFVYDVQSHCTVTDMCCFWNTRGMSGSSSLISMRSIYPTTCQRACSMSLECTASTHDRITENCELHAGAEGEPCLNATADVGFTFCIRKPYKGPCGKVRGLWCLVSVSGSKLVGLLVMYKCIRTVKPYGAPDFPREVSGCQRMYVGCSTE